MEHWRLVIASQYPPFPYAPQPAPISVVVADDVDWQDWLLQLLSGTLGAIIGAVIGAIVVWRIFNKTREHDVKRDREAAALAEKRSEIQASEAAARDEARAIDEANRAKEQRRVDVAADFVTQLQQRGEAYTAATGLWGPDFEQFQQGVANEAARLSTRIILDDPTFSKMLGTMSKNLRNAPAGNLAKANEFHRDVDALRAVVTEWARNPEAVTESAAAVKLSAP